MKIGKILLSLMLVVAFNSEVLAQEKGNSFGIEKNINKQQNNTNKELDKQKKELKKQEQIAKDNAEKVAKDAENTAQEVVSDVEKESKEGFGKLDKEKKNLTNKKEEGEKIGKSKLGDVNLDQQKDQDELKKSILDGELKIKGADKKIKLASDKLDKDRKSGKITDVVFKEMKSKIDNAEKEVRKFERKIKRSKKLISIVK